MAKQAESFVKGTVILTVAALTARVLGVVQRIPLQRILDDSGMATYGIAYNLYFMLLIVAVAGMPTAISKMTGSQLAVGDLDGARKTYRLALRFGMVSGIVLALIMTVMAPQYATLAGVPEAKWAIWCVAPSMLLFPVIAMMRGWYQGHRLSTPSGHSQIVEQIFRVTSTVALAYAGVRIGLAEGPVAALAVLGGTIGGLGALWILIRASRLTGSLQQQAVQDAKQSKRTNEQQEPVEDVSYAGLFKLSVPVSIAALAVPMVYFLDSSLIIPLLQQTIGYDQAKAFVGIMTARAQTLAALPPILAVALSASVVPVIAAAAARKDERELSVKSGQALRLAMFAAAPFILLLALGTPMINELIFGNGNGNQIIILMVLGSAFQISMTVTNGLLNGLGKSVVPMIHVVMGILLKLSLTIVFAQIWGIYGVIFATMAGFLLVTILNRLRLGGLIHMERGIRGGIIRFYLGSAILAGGGYYVLDWMQRIQAGTVVSLIVITAWISGGYALLFLRGRVMRQDEWNVVPGFLRKRMNRWFLADGQA